MKKLLISLSAVVLVAVAYTAQGWLHTPTPTPSTSPSPSSSPSATPTPSVSEEPTPTPNECDGDCQTPTPTPTVEITVTAESNGHSVGGGGSIAKCSQAWLTLVHPGDPECVGQGPTSTQTSTPSPSPTGTVHEAGKVPTGVDSALFSALFATVITSGYGLYWRSKQKKTSL